MSEQVNQERRRASQIAGPRKPEHHTGTRGGQPGRRTMSGTRNVTALRARKDHVLHVMGKMTLDYRCLFSYSAYGWQTATKKQGVSVREHEHSETRAAFGGQSSTRGIGKVYGGFLQNARIVKNFLTLLQKKACPIPTLELPFRRRRNPTERARRVSISKHPC